MHWFLIGFLLNTPITDHFDAREACEGRAVMPREKGADVKCVEFSPTVSGTVGTMPPGVYFTPDVYIPPPSQEIPFSASPISNNFLILNHGNPIP